MAQSVKTLSVYLNLNSKAFTKGLTKMQTRLKKFGQSMSAAGAKMTRSITMPIALVGGAAVKLASDFEASMTKVNTLVGLPTAEVEKLKESVKDLAGQTAQAPQELAEGLYFLTSAGLDAESAMKALDAVSKGVAAGLGEQTDLAKVASAAQNAYGEDVLSASDALDIFGTMVRTGMFEASELAQVLGTQLGLASNLGISMEELGAMIATYTRTTGDANAATTGLSGVMMAFAKITPKQEKALAKVGMTGDSVKKMLGEQGLQKTLFHLAGAFEQQNIPLSEFFSKSQALKGVMGVLGTQTESYTDILEQMGNSQGFVNDAFKTTSETSAFKFQQSLADLKTAGIELGTAILPMAVKIANKISELAKTFSNMSDETRKKILLVVGALALIGPALSTIGSMTSVVSTLIGPFISLASAIMGASLPTLALVGGILAVGTVVALVVRAVIKNWEQVRPWIVAITNLFIDLINLGVLPVKVGIEAVGFAFKSLWDYFKLGINNIVSLFNGLGSIIVDVINFRSPAESFKNMMKDLKTNVSDFAGDLQNNWEDMVNNIQTRKKIELITEDDVQGFVDRGAEMGQKAYNAIQNTFQKGKGLLYDAMFTGGGTGGETGGAGETGGDAGGMSELDKQMQETKNRVDAFFSEETQEPIFEWSDAIKEKFQNTFESMGDSLKNFGLNYAEGFADMVATTITEGGNLAEAFGNFVVSMLKDLSAMILRMLVFKSLMAALNLGTGGAGGAVGGMIGGLFGMAEGGLATGPTPVLVGEGRGTSITNPEVIAPLDKLQSMIGGMGGGRLHGSISGENILLSNQRSLISQDRVGGSITDF